MIKQLLLTLLSASICVLIFPRCNLWPLAWFGLIPFFIAISKSGFKGSFYLGWLFGTIKSIGIVYWIFYAIYVHSNVSVFVSITFFLLATAGFLAFYYAVFALGTFKILRADMSPWLKILIVPCLWVSIEFIRSHLFSGFPWALMGYSQYDWIGLIQMVDLTGVYGLSFLIILSNASLFMVLNQWSTTRKSIKYILPLIILIVVTLVYGQARISHFSSFSQNDTSSSKPIAVIQSSIPQNEKWAKNKQKYHADIFHRLSKTATSMGAKVVVWPETAIPLYLHDRIPRSMQPIFKNPDTTFIIGAPSYHKKNKQLTFHNSAYQISNNKVINQYDKRHLLPFSEYFPLRHIDFFKFRYFGSREYSSADNNVILDTSAGKLGMMICYEVVFPELAREVVDDGAEILVNITNESWFGKTSEHFQHFNMAAFRAIEFRRPLIRSGNTGISGFIDYAGHKVKSLPTFKEGLLVHSPKKIHEATFYCQYGDVFALLCVFILLFTIFIKNRLRFTQIHIP